MSGNDSQNKILFIGAIADNVTTEILNSLGCNVSTAYNVQRKMIDGLENLGYYSDTISALAASPSKRKNLFVNYKTTNRNQYVNDISVSYLNLPMIDRAIKAIKIARVAKRWVKGREETYIFTYSLASYFLLGAVSAKKSNKQCHIIFIVPDLPEFMSNNQNKLYRFLKKIDRKIINRCIKSADAMVLFAEPMKEQLPMEDKPYVIVEGMIKDIDEQEYRKRVQIKVENKEKIIMLSGNLDEEDGVCDLLQAFSRIPNSDYKLWMTGSGNAIETIKKFEKADSRIKYWGYVDSYEKFLEMQQKAFLFVAMVPTRHPKSPYFFPSKIMEYLVTGGLVACHRLACIPKEYDDYLEYMDDDIESISRKLIELCEMDVEVYRKKAIERYQFIEQKTPKMQMKKIEQLLKEL